MIRRARALPPTAGGELHADVVLSRPGGPAVVSGVTLLASPTDLTVVSPSGRAITRIPWGEVSSLRPAADTLAGAATAPAMTAPGDALILEAAGRHHRFLAPAQELDRFLAGTRPFLASARAERAALRRTAAPAHARRRMAPGPAGRVTKATAAATRCAARARAARRSLDPATWAAALHPARAKYVAPRPRHAAARLQLRIPPVAACLGALLLVITGGVLGSISTGGAGAAPQPQTPGGHGDSVSIMNQMAQAYAGSPAVTLPPATAPPAPAPPSLAGAPALRPHEIFGFAPYWTLPQSSGFDLAGMTTLAYFSVDVNGDGTVDESGPGWTGYQSQALANLVTRAHQAGDRVVLTASCFDQQALNQMAADPTSGGRLGATLVQLIEAKNLDGVNIDFEGKGPQDQAGLDTLMAAVSAAVRQADPHDQVTMDTYASAAGDPTGFFDIAGLAPSVDAFFVMAYDMNSPTAPSPTAPLTGTSFSDLDAVEQYVAAVGPSKVILGVPYYGYDWPTAGPGLGDPATGPATAVTYATVAARNSHVYWDPTTETPWTSYQVGSQWYQTWFDNPTSLALKAETANTYHLAGLGIWALGMEGDTPAMLAALDGQAPVMKNLAQGPEATMHPTATTTTTRPPNYFYSGTWAGVPVTLVPLDPTTAPSSATTASADQLLGFATNDPGALCLENGPALAVSEVNASPQTYIVTATPPADCATAEWEFTAPAGAGPPSTTPTTTAPTPPTSTTTTTTTTTDPSSPTSTTSTTSADGHGIVSLP